MRKKLGRRAQIRRSWGASRPDSKTMHWRSHAHHEYAHDTDGASGSSLSLPERRHSTSSRGTTWSEQAYQLSAPGHDSDGPQDLSRPFTYAESEAPSYGKEFIYDAKDIERAEKGSNQFGACGVCLCPRRFHSSALRLRRRRDDRT